MPTKDWALGDEVLAADFNTYLQDQVVAQFTSTTQRDSQWPSPPTGAMCVTTDTNTLWQRSGSGWRPPTIVESNRQLLTLNGATISPTETWLGSITVPTLSYAHRVRYTVTAVFTPAALVTVDLRVRYNTTGAAIALTDTLTRSVLNSSSLVFSCVATGTIDRASGTTTVGVLALCSGGTVTTGNNAVTSQLEVRVSPT